MSRARADGMSMTKSFARLGLTVFLVSTFANVCIAQKVTSTITSTVNWATTRDSRRLQAAEWLREFSDLDREIPTLSPAEQAWLKVEYDDEIAREGHFTPRAIRARHGKDGSARFAKPVTSEAVAVLTELASSRGLSQRDEVASWVRLMSLTLNLNFWADIETLGDLGVLARDPKSKIGTSGWISYQQALHQLWTSRAQSILDAIVLPYLMSQQR
jgi:hypothetical protein